MAVNDITGDNLISRTLTPEGEEAFDRIFGVKKKTNGGWTPPPLEWDEDRIDVVGQNGNTGDHYKNET